MFSITSIRNALDIATLVAREIVPRDTITRLEALMKLRDVLLRAPEQVARPELLALAQRLLPELVAFAQAIAAFVARQGASPSA